MQYDHIKILFDSDPSLFKPWPLPDDWLDDWIVTSPKDIDRLDKIYDNHEFDDRNINFFESRNQNINQTYEQIKLPEAIRDYYKVSKWPATPNLTPSADALGFHLAFHHSPDKHGIYIMEEGILFLAAIIHLMGQKKISEDTARKVSLYFIYFHEVFHHKVEMLATRWELVARKPFYIDSLRDFFQKGKGTDVWPEETLANVFAYEKCINKMKSKLSNEELHAVKISLLECIKNQPEGYRMAADIIEKYGSLSKNFELERFKFWENIYTEYMPKNKSYNEAIWMFGYFDYPLNKYNGKVNFLLPKESQLFDRISLSDRLLSTKQIKKKLKKLGVKELRKGKGSHTVWECETGQTVIPLDKNDMPIGTLNGILKQLGFDMSVHDFIRI